MNRAINRDYRFSRQEIREILVAWLKRRKLPAPEHLGNTNNVVWTETPEGGIRVEFTILDEVKVEEVT